MTKNGVNIKDEEVKRDGSGLCRDPSPLGPNKVGEFEIGDHVYGKRREDGSSDNDRDSEATEECRLCFDSGTEVMIVCDHCLGGFHLKCLTPPLKEVPEGDWICGFCEEDPKIHFPEPPEVYGKKWMTAIGVGYGGIQSQKRLLLGNSHIT